mgnify:CR=1 FL=1
MGEPNERVVERVTPTGESSAAESLSVDVIRDLAALEALWPHWLRLFTRSPDATAFISPTAILMWYRYIEHHKRIYVVVVWSGNELVGLAPFSVTTVWPYRFFTVAGNEYSYPGDPLLGADPAPVANAIIDHLSGLVAGGRATIHLPRMFLDGTVARLLSERSDISLDKKIVNSRVLVRFDQMAEPAEYFRQVARKHAVPRRLRRLHEVFEQVDYVPADPEPDRALEVMRDMLYRRFGAKAPPMVSTPRREAFMRALANQLITVGHAQLSSIVADGRRIACTLALHVGPRTFWYQPAYEPELRQYGIGHIELYEFLRRAYEGGATEVDLGSDKFEYKQRWAGVYKPRARLILGTADHQARLPLLLRRAVMSRRAHQFNREERTSMDREFE